MTHPLNDAFIRAYYETYNAEDADALAQFYSADVELVSAQGIIRGAEQLLQTYREITALFHDKMTPTHIHIDGNIAVVDILDRFTAKQPVDNFLGRPFGTGDQFELALRGTYTVEDGRFTHISLDSR